MYDIYKRAKDAAAVVAAMVARPMALDEYPDIEKDFSPWELFPSVYGGYSGEFDRLMITALEEVLSGNHTTDNIGIEIFKEMMCVTELCDYGTSPRVCFPSQEFREVLPELISKWRAYSIIAWDCDVMEND